MKVALIGIGGHAKVVFESLLGIGVERENIVLRDRDMRELDDLFGGCAFESPELPDELNGSGFHIAIGDNKIRSRLYDRARELGGSGYTVIDRNSHVSESANISEACFVASNSLVAAKADIGPGTILNHTSVIDHDCIVGKFCHIAPGAVLGGDVEIGDHTLVGSGAVILSGIKIGNDVVIGAGSVVTKPVADSKTWIGNHLAS